MAFITHAYEKNSLNLPQKRKKKGLGYHQAHSAPIRAKVTTFFTILVN